MTIALAVALMLSACNNTSNNVGTVSKPTKPTGVGSEQIVDIPATAHPLPIRLNAENNADGTLRWKLGENPVAYLHRGINDIWKGTSDTYQNAASGDGPNSYLENPIVDSAVWEANIQYVIDVTNDRSDDAAILAYLDDVRSKNYSVIDGFGPLTESYVENSGAYTDIPVPTKTQVLENNNYRPSVVNDGMVYTGDRNSDLGEVVALVDAFRQRSPASTNASKYIFSTPRPWRMTDTGHVDHQGTIKDYECIDENDNVQGRTVDSYTTSVKVVPGLMCARRAHSPEDYTNGLYTEQTDNRRKDGGYPSGHTNAGYLAAMAYAYALPQRYSQMLTRGSELGESRIVAGMHSPVDVIGGRVHSTMIAAYALNQEHFRDDASAAYNRAQQFFGDLAEAEGMNLYDYANRDVVTEHGLTNGDNVRTEVYDNNLYDDRAANKELYRFRMTYGLPQDTTKAGQTPIVPEGAEVLLATRQPYLSDAQRRAILSTTSIDSGYPLLDDTNGWGRIDLVTAADGYGAFIGDVTVTMDASEGGFNARDWWHNNISGGGRLTKAGSGQLTLTGENTYSGGTLIQEGTLEAASVSAFGNGDLYLEDGIVLVSTNSTLNIDGNLTMDAGTLILQINDDTPRIAINDLVYIDGGSLVLDFQGTTPSSGTEITLITGAKVTGKFKNIDAGSATVELMYSSTDIKAVVR